MPKTSKPRAGSLQYWPRKRSRKFLPSVNWKAINPISPDTKLLGHIGYKVGMGSVIVKDMTEKSLTKDKRISIPVSIIETPPVKIFSVRFYKNNNLVSEVIVSNEKELKKIIKVPKQVKKIDDFKTDTEKYDDVRIIVYSLVKNTSVKKTPDLTEIGISGSLEEKIKFIKENLGKEILASNVLKNINLVDVRGLTKGKGLSGPVKRFGIRLKDHKSEKGVRHPGNIGPWHPAHVTFRVPMAGQLGMFTRVQYNSKVVSVGNIKEKSINPKSGWKNYGNMKNEYIVVEGSVQGPAKRQLLLTSPLRPTKKQLKKNYEFVGMS